MLQDAPRLHRRACPSGDPRSDEELVAAVRAGDDHAVDVLLARYRGVARAKARTYYLAGADRDDVVQEAMLGLVRAVRDFDPTRSPAFGAFVDLCVTRQVQSAVKAAARLKHRPLNSYVSFARPVSPHDGECTLGDVLPDPACDPAELVCAADEVRALQRHVDAVLSDLETEVLRLYVDGRTYEEIAATVRRHTKAVDNALQRVKRKIEQHLEARALAA